jgi:hypothetical protein
MVLSLGNKIIHRQSHHNIEALRCNHVKNAPFPANLFNLLVNHTIYYYYFCYGLNIMTLFMINRSTSFFTAPWKTYLRDDCGPCSSESFECRRRTPLIWGVLLPRLDLRLFYPAAKKPSILTQSSENHKMQREPPPISGVCINLWETTHRNGRKWCSRCTQFSVLFGPTLIESILCLHH